MKNNILIPIVVTMAAIIAAAYISNFFPQYGAQLSGDTAVWGQFGDYIGGTLNPILSFTSVVLLIRSLTLQNEANEALKNELKNSERTENFRTFSTLFFNMLESQRAIFSNFKVTDVSATSPLIISGTAAVIFIEQRIEELRDAGADDAKISEFLDDIDTDDQIFGILRAFYITVKTICEKLNTNNGFKDNVPKEQIFSLVNFTDFAQLRLVIIGIQFLQYKSCSYLKNNELFLDALDEMNMKLDLY